jgi:hypothetical protein
MALRTRTRSSGSIPGYWIQIGGLPCVALQHNSSVVKHKETTVDDTAFGDGHYFDSTKIDLEGHGVSCDGPRCNGTFGERMREFYPQAFRGGSLDAWAAHVAVDGRPTDGGLAAQLLALTNPSRPVVDLPVAIGELAELPSLFRRFGDSWIRNAAETNIRYQFGVAPLIRDLQSLVNFQSEFAKREREINSLAEGNLRRRRELFRGVGMWNGYAVQTNSGAPGPSYHDVQKVTNERCWGFVRWKPTVTLPRTEESRRNLVRRAVLGLTVDFNTAWQLIPWSWLVDWCTSAGDFLMASRNIIPCVPTGVVIMSHRKTVGNFTRHSSSNLPNLGPNIVTSQSLSDFVIRSESKTRNPSSPSLSAQLPVLSYRQLSIIGSLMIQRYRR